MTDIVERLENPSSRFDLETVQDLCSEAATIIKQLRSEQEAPAQISPGQLIIFLENDLGEIERKASCIRNAISILKQARSAARI